MPTDLTQASAAGLSRLYARGKASPSEALAAILARTERVNPLINAFSHLDTDAARLAARASERRWLRGRPLSALDGVPVSIKELVGVRGWPLSMGSRLTGAATATEDAPVVARLREAGAVLFAQTTSPEFGHKGVTDSPLHGITRNPWKLDRTPGGSSGGSAAAVAAGLGPLAIGTDGGGSIRIPASFCGLVGVKATFGRVPAWPPSLVGDLANTGPMARTALDCALMLNALTRPDARDPYALPPDDTDYSRLTLRPKSMKVALVMKMGAHPLDRDVAAKVRAAALRFEAMGCAVEEVKAPYPFEQAMRTFGIHWFAAMQRLTAQYPPARQNEFDTSLQAQARAAQAYTLRDFADAQAARRDLAFAWSQLFTRFDLLLTPMVAVAPFAVGLTAPPGAHGKPNALWTPYSSTFNLSRHPAATVPCGLTRDGLPIGLQIVSGHYRDALVLAAAARYAQIDPLVFSELPND
jgi:aspartyl-tRNA(Asn)/glutamyl-tRNA(Gln) amidotransferase subunit A